MEEDQAVQIFMGAFPDFERTHEKLSSSSLYICLWHFLFIKSASYAFIPYIDTV